MEKIFEKVLETSLSPLKENTVRIGLFWFSNDYSEVIRIEGERELSNADLTRGGDPIEPIGLHAYYTMPRDCPRGRINYDKNIFRIWVGEDCPICDVNIIKVVKKAFDLKKIDSSRFKVKKHWHWTTKTP